MRILRKEIRRILSIKLLAILVLFSVCFSFLFLSIAQEFWNYSSSQWDVDFYRELVSEFGTELSIDEWDSFISKRQQLIDDFMTEVRKSPVMQKYEIDTYDKYFDAKERLVLSDNMSDDDEELRNEISRLIFEDEAASPISFKLQCMDQICDDKERGHIFTDSESADKFISEMYAGKQNEDYQQLYKRYMTADNISLIHRAATETVDGDLVKMLILSAVWCFVLILPYQIGERLRGIRDIQLCTKTGRKCFNKQAAASVMVGLIIGIMLCAVYAVLLARKGAFDFAACSGVCGSACTKGRVRLCRLQDQQSWIRILARYDIWAISELLRSIYAVKLGRLGFACIFCRSAFGKLYCGYRYSYPDSRSTLHRNGFSRYCTL